MIKTDLERKASRIGVPQMNNFMKAKGNKGKMGSINPQMFENEVKEFIQNKSPFDNSKTEQVNALIFSQDKSMTESQKINNQLT